MKKILVLCGLCLLALGSFAQETMKIAILEPIDREGKLSYSQKLMLRSNLAKAVTNTEGYEAYDRSDVDAIMGEQDFQRTGMVSDDQIRKLGEMTGVSYILVSEGALTEDKRMILAVKLLNVETARVEMTDNIIMKTSTDDMLRGCETLAANLFGSSKVHAHGNATVIQEDYSPYSITKISNKEYKYMGRYMDKTEYVEQLKNCPKAYNYYKSGKTLSYTGWGMLGAGGVTTIVGAVLFTLPWSPSVENLNIAGESLLIIGSIITGVSIPLLCVGYNRQHNAYKQYNKYCLEQKNKSLSLNLTAGKNGVGLALQF